MRKVGRFTLRGTLALAAMVAMSLPSAVFAASTPKEEVVLGSYTQQDLLTLALLVSLLAFLSAILSIVMTYRRFRKRLAERREDLRRAFAGAYVGMRDGATDAKQVREAAQAIDKILTDLDKLI